MIFRHCKKLRLTITQRNIIYFSKKNLHIRKLIHNIAIVNRQETYRSAVIYGSATALVTTGGISCVITTSTDSITGSITGTCINTTSTIITPFRG